MQDVSPRWIRTDQSSDLLNCLEHCLLCFTLARSDERNWKWCVTAAHSAAQIAMVMVLMGDGDHHHLQNKGRLEFIAYLNGGERGSTPKTALKQFNDLYDLCRKSLPAHITTPELKKDIERLNRLRSQWTHFGDYDLSVAVGHARIATLAGIRLVAELPLPSPEYLYRSRTEAARHEVCVSTLLRLLAVDEIDVKPAKSGIKRAAEILDQMEVDDT